MSTLETTKDGMRIYEIGYLIVPSIAEEKIIGEVDRLKSVIGKSGGEIFAEEFPSKKILAYTMVKKIGAVNHCFKEGYFGWVKFEISQDSIGEVKKSFDIDLSILRFLLINTVRENTYLGEKAKVLVKELTKEDGEKEIESEVKVPKHVESNPEEIDKSIDDMVKSVN